ncbi:MAG: FkbM family methyltransferase [Magnetococcales bacterium]|nr:FkbM family methyltransferase [Magnetococcales bacterium]
MNLTGRIARTLAVVWQLPLALLGKKFHALFTSLALESSIRTIPAGSSQIKLFSPNMLTYSRGSTLFVKEPETIEWLNSLQESDLLWDIGANIGLYSLYAASTKKVQVLSFEPSAANYFTLCRNIELNNLDDKISALCLAFNNTTKLDTLNMATTEIGGALSSFASNNNLFGESFNPAFRQGMVGFSIDEFVRLFNPPIPSHIKIDVDGIEGLIIEGAKQLLNNPTLKNISIELDENRQDEIDFVEKTLTGAGFRFQHKKHGQMYDGGQFASCYNYLFIR